MVPCGSSPVARHYFAKNELQLKRPNSYKSNAESNPIRPFFNSPYKPSNLAPATDAKQKFVFKNPSKKMTKNHVQYVVLGEDEKDVDESFLS